MPRGDKLKYTEKQKRQAEHIEEGWCSTCGDTPLVQTTTPCFNRGKTL